MKFLIAVCFFASVALLAGCARQTSSPSWTTKDSWYRPAPSNINFYVSPATPVKDFHVVLSTMLPRAITLLTRSPIVPLSSAQAKAFVGTSFKAVPGKTPFLVRAVVLNEGTGAFDLYQLKQSLLVDHGSLGHEAVPMQRRALVVLLKVRPKQVFVDCEMAE